MRMRLACVSLRCFDLSRGDVEVNDDDGGVVDDLLLAHPPRVGLGHEQVHRAPGVLAAGDHVNDLQNKSDNEREKGSRAGESSESRIHPKAGHTRAATRNAT